MEFGVNNYLMGHQRLIVVFPFLPQSPTTKKLRDCCCGFRRCWNLGSFSAMEEWFVNKRNTTLAGKITGDSMRCFKHHAMAFRTRNQKWVVYRTTRIRKRVTCHNYYVFLSFTPKFQFFTNTNFLLHFMRHVGIYSFLHPFIYNTNFFLRRIYNNN